MTRKTLTDGGDNTLHIDAWFSGRVSLVAWQGGKRTEVGPLDPADLIAAIREAAEEVEA